MLCSLGSPWIGCVSGAMALFWVLFQVARSINPSLSGLCLFFVLMWFPCCICPQSRCLHGATLPSPAVMRTYWKQEAFVTGMSPPPSMTGTWGVAAAAAAAGVQTPHWSLKHLNSLNPTFISPPHFGPLTPPYSLAPLPHATLQAVTLSVMEFQGCLHPMGCGMRQKIRFQWGKLGGLWLVPLRWQQMPRLAPGLCGQMSWEWAVRPPSLSLSPEEHTFPATCGAAQSISEGLARAPNLSSEGSLESNEVPALFFSPALVSWVSQFNQLYSASLAESGCVGARFPKGDCVRVL